ncbi:MAG: LCP family protein [Bacillota bacterium]|nr:LCP family protein [Bacillota bacterium]
MTRRRTIKTGIFIICLILSAYSGTRLALFVNSPFASAYTGEELDQVVENNGNVKLNVLVMGLDKDETRTDTMILASYDSQSQKISMMSIPRDTYVNIKGKSVLLNSAYSIGGTQLTVQKIKELTGMPINYYVVFTFSDFRNVIDSLGGVEFDVRPEGYHYSDPYQNLKINIPGGHQLLDGKAAEGLVRFRADYARADLERVEVQRQFVKALLDQKLNKKYIGSIPKIYYSLKDSLKTNFSLEDLLKYAKVMIGADLKNINSCTLPTTEKGAHLLPDYNKINQVVQETFGYERPIKDNTSNKKSAS